MDSVTLHESGSCREFTRLCPDGYVYNLDVAETHNYFAAGVLVHNCHHVEGTLHPAEGPPTPTGKPPSPCLVGNSWVRVLQHCGAWDGSFTVGCSATPYRPNGQSIIGPIFEATAYHKHLLHLMLEGYLCDLVVKRLHVAGMDLQRVRTVAGDYSAEDLEQQMLKVNAPEQIVAGIQSQAADRRIAIFSPGIAHAEAITALCQARGIPAQTIIGATPWETRQAAYEAVSVGTVQVLSSVMVLTEGFDLPAIDCIVLARATKSKVLFAQALGRGLRLSQETGKTNCIAEGELVLTEKGLMPIETVPCTVKVWDGQTWVAHDGPIYRGEREVLTYAGLTATPDHQVFTRDGWLSFGQCARQHIPILQTGSGRVPIRADAGYFSHSAVERETAPSPPVPLVSVSAVQHARLVAMGRPHQASGGMPGLWASQESATVAMATDECRTTALHESQRWKLSEIWRKRGRVSLPHGARCLSLDTGASGTLQASRNRPHRQYGPLRAWKSPLVLPEAQPGAHQPEVPQPTVACLQTRVSPGAICRRNVAEVLLPGHALSGDRRTLGEAIHQTQRRVWDLLNCGPFHRFTVSGLLVHNCLLLDATGATERHNLFSVAELLGLSASTLHEGESVLEAACAQEETGEEAPALLTEDVQASAVDLVRRAALSWVETRRGAYALSMGGNTFRLLYDDPTRARWTVEVKRKDTRHYQQLEAGLPLAYAFGVAEDTIRSMGLGRATAKEAAWRQRPPSAGQVQMCQKLGLTVQPQWTMGEVSDAITRVTADWYWPKPRVASRGGRR